MSKNKKRSSKCIWIEGSPEKAKMDGWMVGQKPSAVYYIFFRASGEAVLGTLKYFSLAKSIAPSTIILFASPARRF